MKKISINALTGNKLFLSTFAMMLLLMMGCAATEEKIIQDASRLELKPRRIEGVLPLDPQPKKDSIKSGLPVWYFYEFFDRHMDPLGKGAFHGREAHPGKPIPYINHQFRRKKVFDSGTNRGIGLRMKGLIHLNKTGSYAFKALVNDCIRVSIGGKRIIDDPKQRLNFKGDHFTGQSVIPIEKQGWYPITVEYFQRKGTAAIKLFWREPGEKEYRIIPAEAYGHVAG